MNEQVFAEGTKVEALHGQSAVVRGTVVASNRDNTRVLVTHFADYVGDDFRRVETGLVNVVTGYCKVWK